MKVTLEPKTEVMVVTIEDDEDARAFCKAACEVVSEGADVTGRKALKVSYDAYAERQMRDKTVEWHRDLWDYRFLNKSVYGVSHVGTTFGAALMARLGLI